MDKSIRTISVIFQSTLSVRRATHFDRFIASSCFISIHALREESDFLSVGIKYATDAISIHDLREESDILLIQLYMLL